MGGSRFERWGGVAGVSTAILWIASTAVKGVATELPTDPTGEELVAYYRESSGGLLASVWIFFLGVFFFIGFLSALRTTLRRSEGDPGWLSSAAFAAGIAAAVTMTGTRIPEFAVSVMDENLVGPENAAIFWSLGDGFWGASGFPFAVLLGATGLLAVRGLALRRWLGWVSLLLGLVLLILPINVFAIPFAILWIGVVGVLLLLRPSPVLAEGAS